MAVGRKRSLTIEIDIDDKGVKKGSRSVQGEVKGMSKSMDKSAKAIKTAMAVVATGAVVSFGAELKKHGDTMTAIEGRTDTVFGNSADIIRKWAADSNEAFGLSENGVLNLASGLGDLLVPMGFTRAETASMTTEVLEAANAFSEWTGGQVSTEQAAEAVSKAMLGEREQLKTLGISIMEADVQQRLLEKGQKDLTGAALQQAKALATQELIFEKGADALTKYAAGGDEGIRSSKELAAQQAELRDELAQRLAPALQGATEVLVDGARGAQELIKWFDGLDDGSKQLALGIAGVAAAMALLYANPVIAGLALVAGAIAVIGKNAAENEAEVKSLREELEATQEIGLDWIAESLGKIPEKDIERLGKMGLSLVDVKEAMEGTPHDFLDLIGTIRTTGKEAGLTEGDIAELASALTHMKNQVDDAKEAIEDKAREDRNAAQEAEDLRFWTRELTGAQGEGEDAAGDYADETGELGDELQTTADKAAEAKQKIKDLADEQRKAADPVFALFSAQKDYAEKLAEVNQLEQDGKRDTAEYRDAVLDLIESKGDLNQAEVDFVTNIGGSLDAFRDMALEAGLSADEVSELIRQIELLNQTPVTTKIINGAVVSGAIGGTTPGGLPFLAHGGRASGPTVVGEHGPEIVDFGTGGANVIPNGKVPLGGGGGLTLHVHGSVVSGADLTTLVAKGYRDAVRKGMI